MRNIRSTTGQVAWSSLQRRAARVGFAAVIAAAGLVTASATPALAQAAVVPADCGPYSGGPPPVGYIYHEMQAPLFIAPGAAAYFVVGTTGSDTITLTGADDIACGRGGNDSIDGSAGRDKIYGGEDIDDIRGGTGNDFMISGGPDGDTLWGDKGNAGGPYGNDTLQGGDGNDTLNGEGGNDTGKGGSGVDTCLGIEVFPSPC